MLKSHISIYEWSPMPWAPSPLTEALAHRGSLALHTIPKPQLILALGMANDPWWRQRYLSGLLACSNLFLQVDCLYREDVSLFFILSYQNYSRNSHSIIWLRVGLHRGDLGGLYTTYQGDTMSLTTFPVIRRTHLRLKCRGASKSARWREPSRNSSGPAHCPHSSVIPGMHMQKTMHVSRFGILYVF